MTKATDPAFPNAVPENFQFAEPGLTKREYAAIALRVPNSGDAEIDAMIRAAERRDFAAMAMQGLLPQLGMNSQFQDAYDIAVWSAQMADALIAELAKAEPEGVAALDGDGLVPWTGGVTPVPTYSAVVVLFRDGSCEEDMAGEFSWTHSGGPTDIMRYRIVKGGEA